MNIPKAGIMGWPVDHSLSPRIHGWWLKHYNMEGSYERLPVPPEGLDHAMKDLRVRGFRGINLTLPHKETALQYMDYIEDAARHIGAINTVLVREDGTLEGRNTDVYGFTQNLLSSGYKPKGRPVVILGAGGAARAAIAAFSDMGIGEIYIVNRTAGHVDALIKSFGPIIRGFSMTETYQAFKEAELLVNATSLGMKGQPAIDIDLKALPSSALVSDMVYAPLETGLLRMARAMGHPTLDGLGMLLHQARPAFMAFFGRDPEVTDELRRFVLTQQE